MKKLLLVAAIVLFIAGILAVLFGGLCWFAWKNTLDASFDFYTNMRQREMISFAVAAVCIVLGIICTIVRRKMIGA